jgi:hypothetical protein
VVAGLVVRAIVRGQALVAPDDVFSTAIASAAVDSTAVHILSYDIIDIADRSGRLTAVAWIAAGPAVVRRVAEEVGWAAAVAVVAVRLAYPGLARSRWAELAGGAVQVIEADAVAKCGIVGIDVAIAAIGVADAIDVMAAAAPGVDARGKAVRSLDIPGTISIALATIGAGERGEVAVAVAPGREAELHAVRVGAAPPAASTTVGVADPSIRVVPAVVIGQASANACAAVDVAMGRRGA